MVFYFRFLRQVSLLAAPSLIGWAIAPPLQAATFASVESTFDLTNFSHIPLFTNTETDSNTFTNAIRGEVNASAKAEALFLNEPVQANNSILAQANGSGNEYFGIANSQASVLGNFFVEAGQLFSFDFSGFLNLQATIDRPFAETANAIGSVNLAIVDETDLEAHTLLLDNFGLSSSIHTSNHQDFLELQFSDGFLLDTEQTRTQTRFGDLSESVEASVVGSFQRYFDQDTRFALLEIKQGEASVAVPEPGSLIALAVIGGGLCWLRKSL